MRRRKLEMLRQSIELCAASKLWKKLPLDQKTQILCRYTTDKEKIERITASIELPLFQTQLGRNWHEFVRTVVDAKTGPVIVTEEDVMVQHNVLRKAPWDVTIRQVRGLTINQGRFLNVKHIPGGKIEV